MILKKYIFTYFNYIHFLFFFIAPNALIGLPTDAVKFNPSIPERERSEKFPECRAAGLLAGVRLITVKKHFLSRWIRLVLQRPKVNILNYNRPSFAIILMFISPLFLSSF